MIALAVVVTLAMMAACQSETITVTHEVTREVEVTVLVTQPAGEQPSLTKQPSAPAVASVAGAPVPDAPLCSDSGETHDHSQFHTLWDDKRGCHYDHEHGQNPFTPEVAAAAPVVNAAKVPLFIVNAATPALMKMSSMYVRMGQAINQPAELGAVYARQNGKRRG